MRTLSDYTEWLTYFADRLDTSRSLWFVLGVDDVVAVDGNGVALAVPDLEVLKQCRGFFNAFPSVFLALPDEQTRDTVAAAFEEYAPKVVVLLPRDGAFMGRQSVHEVLAAGGQEAVDRLISGATERPMRGLLDLADVEDCRRETMPSVLSGIAELDRLTGGFFGSELSVWTGKRGGGKSTLCGQLLLEAVNQGHRVCAYSGELAAWRFKQWVSLQAAGPDNVIRQEDRFSGQEYFTVPPAIQKQIDEWWRGRFFLYDNTAPGGSSEDGILDTFEYAVRRHGCSVFLVDNLMTTRFSTMRDSDFYRAQSSFVGRLVEFAKRHEVHVHLVAHPRKTEAGRSLSADDVGGSGDISNRADNLFSLERLNDVTAEEKGFDTVLRVLKNRSCGREIALGLCFEPGSRRFFKSGADTAGRQYGWGYAKQTAFAEIAETGDLPF